MKDFVLRIPTQVYFGKEALDSLGKVINTYGNKVLLVYGKGSIKRNGTYKKVMKACAEYKPEFIEYAGIQPNPVVEDVEKAAELGRKEKVDCILAVGGGSVIDSAKFISACIGSGEKAWDFISGKKKPKLAIPLVTVLTLAATGTEMNPFAVLQNNETREKYGYGHPLLYPKASFLDPSLTLSVARDYTAYGITDLIAHALEAFFGAGDAPLSDKLAISIIREAMELATPLLEDPSNYDLRARMMYAATLALNGWTLLGKEGGDWGVHSLGHSLSLLYDTPHGASLSIMYPAWLKLQATRRPEKVRMLGAELFSVTRVEETATEFEKFFRMIGTPVSLEEAGIPLSEKPNILESWKHTNANGTSHPLLHKDYRLLIEAI